MNEQIKEAFDQVRAEEALKQRTRVYLWKKTRGYTRRRTASYRSLVPAVACFFLVLFGGYWLYFLPTAAISIDVNPSIELNVNRFDKVVSVHAWNDDGQALADTLQVKYLDYTAAVEQVLQSETVSALLEDDAVVSIGVIGGNDGQSQRVLAGVEACTAGQGNAYCYCAHPDEVEAAHEAGLSYGKYRAFLELQALDPTVTVEEVQGMTMREIRDRIDALSGDTGGQAQTNTGATGQGQIGSGGSGHHSEQGGHGHGWQENSCG